MRQRLLTLPVMVAIIVSLVWRRVPSIAEAQKVLTREGLLGMAPLRVSPQAITKRLNVLPAAIMGQRFTEVCTRVQAQSPPALPHPRWAPVWERFPLLAIVDSSTLEALRKKTQGLQERPGVVLAGKLMMMVEAFQTTLGFGVRVGRLSQCDASADLCDPDFLRGAGDSLSAGGPSPG